jgi:type II secretory ATPase GspE/PulE/Tfp pilus assembly ATPase PilB-like protein
VLGAAGCAHELACREDDLADGGARIAQPTEEDPRRHAIEHGMTTLLDNGVSLAARGETSFEEVLRVLPPEQRGA